MKRYKIKNIVPWRKRNPLVETWKNGEIRELNEEMANQGLRIGAIDVAPPIEVVEDLTNNTILINKDRGASRKKKEVPGSDHFKKELKSNLGFMEDKETKAEVEEKIEEYDKYRVEHTAKMYSCPICDRKHYITSKVGQKHLVEIKERHG